MVDVVGVSKYSEDLLVRLVDVNVGHILIVQRPSQLCAAARVSCRSKEKHGQPKIYILCGYHYVPIFTRRNLSV